MLYYHVLDVFLFTGLGLLGISYHLKDRITHIVRALGFILFGLFWLSQVPHYLSIGDVVNAGFTGVGLPFFAYLAWHERLSYKRDEEHRGLKFVAGMSFLAGVVYYMVARVPWAAGSLIHATAVQTVWIVNAFGNSYGVGPIDYAGNALFYRTQLSTAGEISVPIIGSDISIILACTALQSMLIFASAVYATQAPVRKRVKALLATVPVIYALNLVRNVGIIYLVDFRGMDFHVAHNYVGKAGSLIALLALAYIIFKILPETLENVSSLWGLPDRNKERASRRKRPPPASPCRPPGEDGPAEQDVPPETLE